MVREQLSFGNYAIWKLGCLGRIRKPEMVIEMELRIEEPHVGAPLIIENWLCVEGFDCMGWELLELYVVLKLVASWLHEYMLSRNIGRWLDGRHLWLRWL